MPLSIRCIIGLGNPGEQYKATRHNCGFCFLDRFLSYFPGNQWKHENRLGGEISILPFPSPIYLLKPSTYMNLSGQSTQKLLNYYRFSPENLLLIYDDLDTKVGNIRIKESGSAGGHNGVASVLKTLNHPKALWRIKIGIGRPDSGFPIEQYVLQRASSKEKNLIEETMIMGCTELLSLLQGQLPLLKFQEKLHLYNKT